MNQKTKDDMTPMKTSSSVQEPTHDEIALSAFLTWEKEGRQPGRELTYWLRAEAEIRSFRQKKAETAAAQSKWPSQPSAASSRTVKSKTAPSSAAKPTPPAAQKLTTKVERETTVKSALPSRTVSVRRTALKPTR